MLYREIIAVCSQIHTKDINTLCGQKVEFLHIKNLVLHKLTTGFWADRVKQAPGKGEGRYLLCKDQLWSSLHLWTSNFYYPIFHHSHYTN